MTLTPYAQWLNESFASFDRAILSFYHSLAESAAPFLTPFSEFFAFIGDGALLCFVLAAILLFFPKTRKAGIAILFSVGVGALITNVAIKNIVARPRPFAMEYTEWWNYIGSPSQSEFSFPSGHTTAAMTGMVGLCLGLEKNRKWWVIVSAVLYVIVMGATRNYLMVHYPSDILGGIIAGAIGGISGYLLTRLIYKGINSNKDSSFCAFLLCADVRNLFRK